MSMLMMSPSAMHRVVGDAVADHLVQRGAQRLRVAPVAQRARVGAVIDQELVPDPVQFVGGDARARRAGRPPPAPGPRGGPRPASARSSPASLTSGSPVHGRFLPTYSGRGMCAGTCRVGEIRPGWSIVAMVWKSSGMSDDPQWWYCLRHNRPERNGDCPGKDRLGPYATEEEAARALETVRRRNEEWDAARLSACTFRPPGGAAAASGQGAAGPGCRARALPARQGKVGLGRRSAAAGRGRVDRRQHGCRAPVGGAGPDGGDPGQRHLGVGALHR